MQQLLHKPKKMCWQLMNTYFNLTIKQKELFVEIEISDQNFEKRQIEVGISDGVLKYQVVLSMIIKVWNKTDP